MLLPDHTSRRDFLKLTGAGAIALAAGCKADATATPGTGEGRGRVVLGHDDVLAGGELDKHVDLMTRMLGSAVQRLTGKTSAAEAWGSIFSPKDTVGIKVNCLGLPTSPAVVKAIVNGLLEASVPAERIIIWDRFDVELAAAGHKLNRGGNGARCYGTDASTYGSGYEREIESSGSIGSCFSRIVARECTALISASVLKDHNLAGISGALKNFFGAIHNPNKYHEHNCDPYVADVVAHRHIGPKLRLAVCDVTRGQYHAGPARHPAYAWKFGGLLVSRDAVAADRVGCDLLERERRAHNLDSLAAEKRPAKHILTAATRGLGIADLERIEVIEL